MTEDATAGCGEDGVVKTDSEAVDGDARRFIEALMSEPPKGLPSILVFGDDAVFGITPAKRPA